MTNSIDAWSTIATVCFILALAFMVIAVVMFFTFDIRKIRKELSGKQVESYMEEYRRKRDQSKRVGIYDPSGKLISDVKSSNVAARSPSGRMTPKASPPPPQSMGDALAEARKAAAVKSDNATQVLAKKQHKDFVIIKDYLFSECSEYIG